MQNVDKMWITLHKCGQNVDNFMQYFCINGYIMHKYAIYSTFYQVYAKKTVYTKNYPQCLLLLLLKISKKIDIYYTRTIRRESVSYTFAI